MSSGPFIGSGRKILWLAGSGQGSGFPQGDRGQVPCGTRGAASESELFPADSVLPWTGRTPWACEGELFGVCFYPLDWEKSFIKYGFKQSLLRQKPYAKVLGGTFIEKATEKC
jgi:hypothetical protein